MGSYGLNSTAGANSCGLNSRVYAKSCGVNSMLWAFVTNDLQDRLVKKRCKITKLKDVHKKCVCGRTVNCLHSHLSLSGLWETCSYIVILSAQPEMGSFWNVCGFLCACVVPLQKAELLCSVVSHLFCQGSPNSHKRVFKQVVERKVSVSLWNFSTTCVNHAPQVTFLLCPHC